MSNSWPDSYWSADCGLLDGNVSSPSSFSEYKPFRDVEVSSTHRILQVAFQVQVTQLEHKSADKCNMWGYWSSHYMCCTVVSTNNMLHAIPDHLHVYNRCTIRAKKQPSFSQFTEPLRLKKFTRDSGLQFKHESRTVTIYRVKNLSYAIAQLKQKSRVTRECRQHTVKVTNVDKDLIYTK